MRRDDDDAQETVPAGESEPAIDLSALRGGAAADRAGHDARIEALARRVLAAASPELARRRRVATPDLADFLARARRPALVAAAAAAAFAIATARFVGPAPAQGDAQPESVAQALRVDEPAASWIVAERAPSAHDLAHEIGLDELTSEAAR